MVKTPPRSRRATTTAVFGVLLMILVTCVSGVLFYTFVMDNITFTTETLNTKIADLLLSSFSMNSTHIVAFLKNTGSQLIEVTSAYVNGIITIVTNLVKIAPDAVGTVVVAGSFIAGQVYNVALGNIFNTQTTFEASF